MHCHFSSIVCKLNLYIIRFDSSYSGMLIDTLFGHHLLAITLQLWCCQYQVNAHSHLQGSQLANIGIDSSQTLSRHCNSWSASTAKSFFSMKSQAPHNRLKRTWTWSLSWRTRLIHRNHSKVGTIVLMIFQMMKVFQILITIRFLYRQSHR